MKRGILNISDLNGLRGREKTIKNIDIILNERECLVIFGANGAGKTTLIRTIMGLEKTLTGTIQFNGQDLQNHKARNRAHLGIGFCPEGRRLFPGLTVWETLAVSFNGTKKMREKRIDEMFELLPALKIKTNERAWSLSGGQQQMLAIARATINKPQLILLDEPTLGLSPIMIDQVMEIIGSIKNDGAAIIMAEQSIEPSLSMADFIVVLSRGEIIYKGSRQDIDHNQIASMVMTGNR